MLKRNPNRLLIALECLKDLSDKSWIDTSSIDIWMLSLLDTIPASAALYTPSFFINPIESASREEQEIANFRNIFGLPPVGEPCPLKPIVYILNCSMDGIRPLNHFCVVICDPKRQTVYLLCKQKDNNNRDLNSQDWDSWNGHRIRTQALKLMGWDEYLLQPWTLRP